MRRSPRVLLLSFALSSLGVTLGCGSDTTGPTTVSAAQQFWALTLNHHAITLATIAPYDTIQLVATPRTVTGAPLITSARPIFTSSDTSIKIDSTGLVSVHTTATKSNITVVAKLTVGGLTGLTLVDTAIIDVVAQQSAATVPVLTTFSFQPAVGDSARLAIFDGTKSLAVKLLDASGNKIPSATYTVHYASADTTIATIFSAIVTTKQIGHVLLTAETAIYGVYRTDTLQFTVGWPLAAQIFIDPQPLAGHDSTVGIYKQAQVTVGIGAAINWTSNFPVGGQMADVLFDDPSYAQGWYLVTDNTACMYTEPTIQVSNGGDIPNVDADTIQQSDTAQCQIEKTCSVTFLPATRVFRVMGPVTYHSALYGTSGVILVQSNDSVP